MSETQLERLQRGLRMVTVPFPHLAGLAAATRIDLDERVPTMGVFASGRLVANPRFVARLKDPDLVFVLAHELLHLALRTHDRARGSDRLEFNFAHDYLINDLLRAALGRTHIPAGGLDMPGARKRSAEEILLEMRRNGQTASRTRVFDGEPTVTSRQFGRQVAPGRAGAEAGDDAGDVLADALERELFPDAGATQAEQARRMAKLADRARQLARAMGALRGTEAGGDAREVDAQRGAYRTAWTHALQRWLESVAPGERTFVRPSRRGERADVVLPGRRREGWMLHVVLDTSGSMSEELPRALGALADFCDAAGVDRVRLVQCDAAITADALVEPHALARHTISGYGGSDLSPALAHLAADPHVRAIVALTDGDIAYPAIAPPYDVLWVLPPRASGAFAPPYGRVLRMDPVT